jgi:hypothetical protein
MSPAAQAELDKSVQKCAREKVVRIWDRSVEGAPVFTTPVLAVPKKNVAEAWRTIGDYRDIIKPRTSDLGPRTVPSASV